MTLGWLWTKKPSSFWIYLLGILLLPRKQVRPRLLNDKKACGDREYVENNHDAPGSSQDHVP